MMHIDTFPFSLNSIVSSLSIIDIHRHATSNRVTRFQKQCSPRQSFIYSQPAFVPSAIYTSVETSSPQPLPGANRDELTSRRRRRDQDEENTGSKGCPYVKTTRILSQKNSCPPTSSSLPAEQSNRVKEMKVEKIKARRKRRRSKAKTLHFPPEQARIPSPTLPLKHRPMYEFLQCQKKKRRKSKRNAGEGANCNRKGLTESST